MSKMEYSPAHAEFANRPNPGAHIPSPAILPEKYSFNPSLENVQNWESFDLDSISDALRCDAVPLSNRPIHGASTFRRLRDTYEDVVGSERSSITHAARGLQDEGPYFGTPTAAESTGLVRAVEIPGRCRGLVAARDIKKGEQMWSDLYFGES